jgi:hypothetical protein
MDHEIEVVERRAIENDEDDVVAEEEEVTGAKISLIQT